MPGCRGVRAGGEVVRDQRGSVLGVDEPGRVSGWQLVKPAVLDLIDGGPRALDGQVGVAGSEDEDRGCRDRGEFRAGDPLAVAGLR
jgi:hypothetical protein